MARPRKDDDARRSECFAIRLTPAERLALIAEAGRLSMSPTELARQRLLKARVVVREHRQLDPRQVFELGKIGVNLNQIARALNSGQNINPAAIEGAIAELKPLIASLILGDSPEGVDGAGPRRPGTPARNPRAGAPRDP
ncbi:MAG: hypothetical protein QOH47_988 [Sphingomonadales bacterium]|jgi:hypothetical protein|nr:hypothetical protein [Sphingomonadales bacterium]